MAATSVLTDPDLPSGTDRIFQALGRIDPERRFARVINLQGDLPTLEPAAIRSVLEPLELLGTDIGTLAVATEDPLEKADPNVVKAIIAFDPARPRLGRALYFTRATAPSGDGPVYHHIGIYAFSPRRAGALRHPAAEPARAARAARAAARARGRPVASAWRSLTPIRSASILRTIWSVRAGSWQRAPSDKQPRRVARSWPRPPTQSNRCGRRRTTRRGASCFRVSPAPIRIWPAARSVRTSRRCRRNRSRRRSRRCARATPSGR